MFPLHFQLLIDNYKFNIYIGVFVSFLLYSLLHAQLLSCVWLFVTPWTVALQAPLSIGLSWQKYWNGLPFPPLGDLPDSGIESASPAALPLTGGFLHLLILDSMYK